MKNINEKIIKTLKIIIGLLVSGIGTAFLFNVGWGSAPASTITEGISIFFHINYGPAGIAINIIFLILLIILNRKLIGVGTVLATFCFGYFIDIGIFLVSPLNISQMSVYLKIVMVLIGCFLTAVGLGYYIGQSFGSGAMDGMSIIINEKTGIQFKYCRWTMDFIMMLLGVLMGAACGVGTILSIILTGPIMQFVIDHINKKNSSNIKVDK